MPNRRWFPLEFQELQEKNKNTFLPAHKYLLFSGKKKDSSPTGDPIKYFICQSLRVLVANYCRPCTC